MSTICVCLFPVSTWQRPSAQSHKEIVFPVWCRRTGLLRALTSTPSNTFGMNWNTNCKPDPITQHQCWTRRVKAIIYGCNMSTYFWPYSVFRAIPASYMFVVFSFISVLRLSWCFYSRADLSSEVTFIRALDWLLFIWPLPPSPAEEKWSVVEMWWKIKTLSFSFSLQWAFFQQTMDNKILYKQFLKSDGGVRLDCYMCFIFHLTCVEQRQRFITLCKQNSRTVGRTLFGKLTLFIGMFNVHSTKFWWNETQFPE